MTKPEYEYQDDAQAVEILKKHLNGQALRPPKNVAPKRMVSARISTPAHIGLQAVAKRLGYVHNGQGNISLLLEAIGAGVVQVMPSDLQAYRL